PDRAWAKELGAESDSRPGQPMLPSAWSVLAERWTGKRIVIVGSRRDPELQRSLSTALPELEIEWWIGEPRLLPELVPARRGQTFRCRSRGPGASVLGG
ncbi:MAG: hypothetical protein HC923_05950, partial [Myxococcales bacterium]|nr:hypothetical protein [Myxococcales bacterium]